MDQPEYIDRIALYHKYYAYNILYIYIYIIIRSCSSVCACEVYDWDADLSNQNTARSPHVVEDENIIEKKIPCRVGRKGKKK